MNRTSRLLVPMFALLGCMLITHGQQGTPTPVFDPDETGNLCWNDEAARLTGFAKVLLRDTSTVGYVVVYAGYRSCKGEARYRAERARKWIIKQGVEADRVIAVDGGYRDEVSTVLWALPRNAPPVEPYSTYTKDQVIVKNRCVDKVYYRVICPKLK